MCHVMSAPIAGRVGLVSCSHICLKWLRESDRRSSYDAAFKLRIIESAENSNNYAAGRQLGVPTTYTWERLIGECIYGMPSSPIDNI